MKKLLSCICMAGVLFLSGCASGVSTKGEVFPNMYDEKPVSILVVPSKNISTAADAPDLYSSTVNQVLSDSGFYVMPIGITERFLINEGITDGTQVRDVTPQKLGEVFGADAVLYATIEKWDTNYLVVAGSVVVKIDFELKSCKTGDTLWSYNQQIEVDTSGDASGHWIVLLVATAIKTATQNYVPLAKQVNGMAFKTVPYGKYHESHGQDQQIPVLIW